jgi:hypothetical protein
MSNTIHIITVVSNGHVYTVGQSMVSYEEAIKIGEAWANKTFESNVPFYVAAKAI